MNAFFRSTTWRLFLMPLLISLSALFGSAAVALIPIWLAAIFALIVWTGLVIFPSERDQMVHTKKSEVGPGGAWMSAVLSSCSGSGGDGDVLWFDVG
jgi:hypothetical protein